MANTNSVATATTTNPTYNLLDGIPSQYTVRITGGGAYKSTEKNENCDINLFLDEDTTIKCNSKFGPLWQAQPNNLTSLLSSSFGLPSGQFALQGAQIWQGTDPLTMSFTGTLYMDKDPYTDVVRKAQVLMGACLPELGDENNMSIVSFGLEKIANKVLGISLQTLIPPGPNIQTLLSSMAKLDDTGNPQGLFALLASTTDLSAKVRGMFTIKIGQFKFEGCVIKSVTPTFSRAMAESSSAKNYYPISAKLNIEFETIQVATIGYVSSIA